MEGESSVLLLASSSSPARGAAQEKDTKCQLSAQQWTDQVYAQSVVR